jgi:DNA ligase-1
MNSLIGKKNYSIPLENMKYFIFDILTKEELKTKTSKLTLSERLKRLDWNLPNVIKLEQFAYKKETFEAMKEESIAKGWEGLIIRADTTYKGKRSFDIMKYKLFIDEEFTVKRIDTGENTFINTVNGKTVSEKVMCMNRFFINYKGEEVGVGSGLSHEQKLYYYEHPEELIGKLVTIKHFGETKDKTGKLSLRFPVLKAVVGDKREY